MSMGMKQSAPCSACGAVQISGVPHAWSKMMSRLRYHRRLAGADPEEDVVAGDGTWQRGWRDGHLPHHEQIARRVIVFQEHPWWWTTTMTTTTTTTAAVTAAAAAAAAVGRVRVHWWCMGALVVQGRNMQHVGECIGGAWGHWWCMGATGNTSVDPTRQVAAGAVSRRISMAIGASKRDKMPEHGTTAMPTRWPYPLRSSTRGQRAARASRPGCRWRCRRRRERCWRSRWRSDRWRCCTRARRRR